MRHYADPLIVNGVAYVSKAVNPNDCTGCAAEHSGVLCGKLGAAATGDCFTRSVIFVKKEETMTTENQQVAGPEHEAALQLAVTADDRRAASGVPAATFVAARQAAWDKYADARAKTSSFRPQTGQPRYQGFMDGFAAGVASVQPMIDALRLASEVKPAPKKGKLTELIVESLTKEGPASAHTLAARLGRQLNSVSPRAITLKAAGRIIVSGSEPATNGRGQREVYAAASYN